MPPGDDPKTPPTARQAFNQYLPIVNEESVAKYTKQESSGNTTENTDPVKVYLDQSHTYWSSVAEGKLRDEKFNPKNAPLLDIQIEPAGGELLATEADVKLAFALYVMTVVKRILDIEYGGRVKIGSEVVTPGNTRIDMVYVEQKSGEKIAAIEFKRRGSLAWDDFEPAWAYNKEQVRKLLKPYKTLVSANGLTFSKQAAAYAIQCPTPFIALFDWDVMVLFEFNEDSIEEGNVGDVAHATWFEENGGSGDDTFRKMLLGWVLKACDAKGIQPS